MRIHSITLCDITIQIVTASCQLIFLPCVCFASIYASTAAKSYILNYMWTAAILIHYRRPQVMHR